MTEFLRKPFGGPADWIMTLLTISIMVVGFGWATFDVRGVIEVRRQHVYQENGTLLVDVDRTIFRSFRGGYEVTIWTQGSGARWCTSGYQGPSPYRLAQDDGSPVRLPDPTTLAYWIEGDTCSYRFDEPWPAGRYTMQTCHTVEWPRWYVPIGKRECWPLVAFDVEASEEELSAPSQ